MLSESKLKEFWHGSENVLTYERARLLQIHSEMDGFEVSISQACQYGHWEVDREPLVQTCQDSPEQFKTCPRPVQHIDLNLNSFLALRYIRHIAQKTSGEVVYGLVIATRLLESENNLCLIYIYLQCLMTPIIRIANKKSISAISLEAGTLCILPPDHILNTLEIRWSFLYSQIALSSMLMTLIRILGMQLAQLIHDASGVVTGLGCYLALCTQKKNIEVVESVGVVGKSDSVRVVIYFRLQVWPAPNYCYCCVNVASMLCFNENMVCVPTILLCLYSPNNGIVSLPNVHKEEVRDLLDVSSGNKTVPKPLSRAMAVQIMNNQARFIYFPSPSLLKDTISYS